VVAGSAAGLTGPEASAPSSLRFPQIAGSARAPTPEQAAPPSSSSP